MKSDFYINNQPQLEQLLQLAREVKILAIDTEFTRETTYYPVLSIIQVGIKNPTLGKQTFIIDCLSKLDLSGFFNIISDPKIIKILHSSTQDLQIFFHKSGQIPHGIIDTQIMANFCGFDFSVGYSTLVEKFFQKHLSKDQQRSNWQRRPLSQKQIEYAMTDVLFLEEIYEKLYEILVSKNRLSWCFEEMKLFITKILGTSESNLSKDFSFKNRTPKQIAQIKNIILWREQWAKKLNVPRRHFLKDEAIVKIVTEKTFSPSFTQKMIEEIKKILEEEHHNKLDHSDNPTRESGDKIFFMSAKQKSRYKNAKNLVNKIAVRENLKEQFLISSSDLRKIIHQEKIFNEKISGWRYELFGKELEQLIFNN